jgi:uncharacterized heparinase superfamily protein
MSRGAIAERARLSLLVARRGIRLLTVGARANPLLRWRMLPAATDRLLIAPQDLRTADPTRASEIYAGRFAFAGKIVSCDGRSPFAITPPSSEWVEVLAGFGWLRHLRAAESGLTRSNARSLIDEWMAGQRQPHAAAWRAEVVSRRIISWLTHAPFLLHDADMGFYRRFLRSLGRQVRYLRRAASNTRDGLPRLQAFIALTCASLCMAGQMRNLNRHGRRLSEELERQILPDGGHASRNPGALIELLLDLLPLRQAFGARNLEPPEPLSHAIERMMPMLRFFRHGDGAFANFNGMGPTPPDLLATVLAYDDTRGRPVANAAHSGYQRMEGEGALVLMDTGHPPPTEVSQEAHASCLAFEFSASRHRIVVNCGLPETGQDGWRQFARETASHSTLTFDEASSCRFVSGGLLHKLVGAPILSGPRNVPVLREDDLQGTRTRASHDGYALRFGIVHERVVTLSADGKRLDGEDAILPVRGNALSGRRPDAFTVRFHLHPAVQANRLTHRHGVMLMLPNRDIWTFEAYEHEVALEDSVYLAGPHGARHAVQIAIHAHARETPRISWSFVRIEPAEASSIHRARETPELPL